MYPIFATIIATLFFALGNVITEQKFSKIDNLTFVMGWTSIVFAWAAVSRFLFLPAHSASAAMPLLDNPPLALWFLFMGTLYFCGNYLIISAFTSGGHVVMIAAVGMLMPLFVALFRMLWVLEFPNPYYIGAYVLGMGAVSLVIIGHQVK